MDYMIQQSRLEGRLDVPPSKSQSMRAILWATMAKGTSVVRDLLPSPDIDAMLSACQQLGAEITQDGTAWHIKGVAGCPCTPANVIDVGNSGLVLRFITSLACLCEGYTAITGDASIRSQRPMEPLIEGLRGLGGYAISTQNNGLAPIVVRGPLKAGFTQLQGHDSQPVSALLMTAPFLEGTTTIEVTDSGEKPFVALTLSWLQRLGIEYTNDDFARYSVTGRSVPEAFCYSVPGDHSSAAYPVVAALLTNSEVTIHNVDISDHQGDKKLFDVLRRMGADLVVNEASKSIRVGTKHVLKGITIDINDTIDALTLLAVVACFADGETQITNGEINRYKECDRIACIARELTRMGADIEERPDGLVIRQSMLQGAEVHSYNDHRMAMSLAIAGLASPGTTYVRSIGCVAKSFPSFALQMQQLHANIQVRKAPQ